VRLPARLLDLLNLLNKIIYVCNHSWAKLILFCASTTIIHEDQIKLFRNNKQYLYAVINCYWMHGPWIESRWRHDFSRLSRPALGTTQPPIQWVLGLSRGQSGQGVALNSHPYPAPRLKRVERYLYSTSGPS